MVQRASLPRPLLLVLALAFAAVTILYSAVWMYAARWEPEAVLGVNYQYSAVTHSLRIAAVEAGTAAEQAGLSVDDHIVAANGQPFESSLFDAVAHGRPGDVVSLTIERPGEPAPFTGTVRLTVDRQAPPPMRR